MPWSAQTVSEVACNGCTACCRGELVVLHPEEGDDRDRYMTRSVIDPSTGRPAAALQHNAAGDCIYLGPTGCTIHAYRPAMCRLFDCRKLARDFWRLKRGPNRALAAGMRADSAVLKAGRERLHTLEKDDNG